MIAVEHKGKDCTFLLAKDKVFIKTNLQFLLLESLGPKGYVDIIRENIEAGNIKRVSDLYSFFFNEQDNCMVVNLVSVREKWYE